jgi:uncharacterized heparinase superfamily protein
LGIEAARSPSPQRRLLAESGYLRAEAAGAVLILDVAPVGPDYLPGHAHADTLSFELSLFGQRVFCNGGTSRYGPGAGARSRARHGRAQHGGDRRCGFLGSLGGLSRRAPCAALRADV